MKREDLFLAIGEVEESRLARLERMIQESSAAKQEEPVMTKRKGNVTRILRNVLVAAILVSMLAITAYAVGAYLIYDSPEELLTAIFGDKTGFDHKGVTTMTDPWDPDTKWDIPAYDRVPANETVVAQDIAPHVSPVGKTIQYNGYSLTVDAFLYDSATQCGLVTYTLERGGEPIGYSLQTDGEVWYEGIPDPAHFSHYGYSYIIQEKSTEMKLAATYYFRYEEDSGDFFVKLYDAPSYDTRMRWMKELLEQVKAENTPEEAIAKAKEMLGADNFEIMVQESTYDTPEDIAYTTLRDYAYMEEYGKTASYESPDKITFDCSESSELNYVTLADGAVIISPISFVIDVLNLEYLHKDHYGETTIEGSNVNEVVISFTDGTEYMAIGDNVWNVLFALNDSPYGSEMEEKRIPAEESSGGEGYWVSKYIHPQSRLNLMFNRIIDVEKITSVRVNGTELTLD